MEEQIISSQVQSESVSAVLDPLQDGISSLELVRVSGSDLDIVNAARVSYGKQSTTLTEKDKQLLGFLMEHNHTSPFEHNQLSFRIKAPIFVTREWMRHRMNSFNEISYRFVKAKVEFYIPAQWRYQDTVNKQSSIGAFANDNLTQIYKKAIADSYAAYETLLAQGVAREQARGVLPVSIYTEFFYTCNLHSLMHFLKLRLAKGAQQEIRCYARGLLHLAYPHFSVSLDAWKKKHMADFKDEEWSIDFVQNLSNTNGQ